MGRTVQGTTLGGDFTIKEVHVSEGMVRAKLETGTDEDFEVAKLDLFVVQSRFSQEPFVGDRHRVVVGMEPLESGDDYADQRETTVGVPISLLVRVHGALTSTAPLRRGDAEEIGKILQAVSDFASDLQGE